MMIVLKTVYGHVSQCRSDDGLVEARACPLTTLYGDFALVETATGRSIDRGVYMDYSRAPELGSATDERVPADIWASACNLMREWGAQAKAREDAGRERALQRDLARYDSLSERIAQDMDRADSDL